jgi:hypothetical protein
MVRESKETVMNSWRGIMVVACTLFVGSTAWSQPARGELTHPCDILTEEDAQYVFGKGAHLVRSGRMCNIQPEDNRFLTQGVIAVWLGNVNDQNWASAKGLAMMAKGMGAKQVGGLGDDAYIWLGRLLIKKGGAQAAVSGWYADFAKKEEAIRYIGEKLLAGM